MNAVTDTSSPVSKRSTSPRPPAVGEEVKQFHDTPERFPEPYKNWNMECNSKTSHGESTDKPVASVCTESVTDAAENTENSPNSIHSTNRWAQSLHYLLEDINGVTLFQKFLKQEGQDDKCLSFWFACRGVKKSDPNDREGLVKLIKVVFERHCKRIPAISDETKESIKQKLKINTDVDVTIFDVAQQEVEYYLMKTTYPNFLKSELYIQHVTGISELTPEKERVITPDPVEQLPTLHEDAELHLPSRPSLTKFNLLQRNKASYLSKPKTEAPVGYLRSPYSYSSYHTKYGTFLPVSAQDSELQSMSSDAQTDDTMSLADSSVADYPVQIRTKHKCPQKSSKHASAMLNRDMLKGHASFIPLTQRKEEAKKPLSPEEFHAQVVKKLNDHIKSLKNGEKVVERLKSVEGDTKPDGASFPAPHQCKPNNNPVFGTAFLTDPAEENVQAILDQHISRVFDSGQQTPASGCLSPPVARSSNDTLVKSRIPVQSSSNNEPEYPSASYKHSQISQFTVPNSMKCRRDHDTYSTDSAMFDYKSDDNLPSGIRSQYSSAVNSEPVDYSRRYKEHSKRYSSKKLSAMSESSSCVDSGISLACASVPSYSKVTHWLETKRMTEQEREQHMWRNSSTSPVLSRSSSSRKTGCNNYRGAYQDVACSQWPAASAPMYIQDTSGFSAPDTTTNLQEARRRLEDSPDTRTKMRLKNNSGTRNSHDASRMKVPKGYETVDDGFSHRKPNRKSLSLNVIEQTTGNLPPSNDMTVIGYSYGRLAVPYLSKIPGKNITLRQFKTVLSKKGNFRYFFKTASNDFGTGVVFEEVTDDSKILPLWEGKVFCVIESMDDNTVV